MSYATYEDVQDRLSRPLTEDEQNICTTLLCDAGVIIDSFNADASLDIKKVVSCRMVIRAIGEDAGVPMGATQPTVIRKTTQNGEKSVYVENNTGSIIIN